MDAIIIVFGLIAIIYLWIIAKNAKYKGFNPWPWFLSGIFGIVVILLLPSANADDLTEETIEKRRTIGVIVGIVVTGVTIFAALN